MNKSRTRLMHGLAWVFLFGFTATCTLFFFLSIVPGSLWWLPVVAFVAFEYGVIQWMDYHRHGAENGDQWWISLLMIIVSVAAVTIATGLELMQWFSQAGLIKIDLWWRSYAVWAVIAVFPLNLVALVFCQLRSPAHLRRFLEVAQSEGTIFITPDVSRETVVEQEGAIKITPPLAGEAANGHAPHTQKQLPKGSTPPKA